MTTLKCPVSGCDAVSFGTRSQPLPEHIKHSPMAAGQKPREFLCCSNGHVLGLDYTKELADIRRELDLIKTSPARK